jgi:hypothetical protein
MRQLNDLIIRCSQSWRLFLLSVIVAFGSLFAVFGPIQIAFAELTGGLTPFDFQNSLSVEQIFEQLAVWNEAAVQLYYAFSFVDFFFPFFAGLFLASIAAFSLRHLAPRLYDRVARRRLFVLLMLGPAFDWLENLCALFVIGRYPAEMTAAAGLLVVAKQGKLAAVMLTQLIAFSLLVLAAGRWGWTRVARGRRST